MIITISQIIFAVCALGILIIVLRKIPLILRYPRHPFEDISVLERIKDKINSSNIFHEIFVNKTEKFLRKVKIIVLKIDNFLAKRVGRLRDRIRKKKQEEEEEMPM